LLKKKNSVGSFGREWGIDFIDPFLGELKPKPALSVRMDFFLIQSLRQAWIPEMKKAQCFASGFAFAESGGFEPPVRNYPYDSLANCWFKPLTQLSNFLFLPVRQFIPIAIGMV
jgi:hypothetical protein